MYTLPTFNLTILIWRNANTPPGPPPDGTCDANLANGKRTTAFVITSFDPGVDDTESFGVQQLLVPKGTDIRGVNSNTGPDWLEIPAGSGVYFTCRWVQYVAKGFANEHLLCWVNQTTPWIDPLP